MKLRQKSRWGLLGVLGCGFFAPTASTGMLFQSPNAPMIENIFFFDSPTQRYSCPYCKHFGGEGKQRYFKSKYFYSFLMVASVM